VPIVKNAILSPIPGSTVSAHMQFTEADDGSTLSITGTATGMAPLGVYVSLVYGLQSNANVVAPFTPPGPCVDDQTLGAVIPPGVVTPGNIIFDPTFASRMLVGVWQQAPSTGGLGGVLGGVLGRIIPIPLGTTRVLSLIKPTASPLGVHLNEVLTVSIRRVAPGLSTFNDFRPQFFPLQCCGQIM